MDDGDGTETRVTARTATIQTGRDSAGCELWPLWRFAATLLRDDAREWRIVDGTQSEWRGRKMANHARHVGWLRWLLVRRSGSRVGAGRSGRGDMERWGRVLSMDDLLEPSGLLGPLLNDRPEPEGSPRNGAVGWG